MIYFYHGEKYEWAQLHARKENGSDHATLIVHGGGWDKGSPENANLEGLAEVIPEDVFAMTYRLATEKASYPGVYWDVQNAINYLRDVLGYRYITLTCASAGSNIGFFSTLKFSRSQFVTADRLKLFYGFYNPAWLESLNDKIKDKDTGLTVRDRYLRHIGEGLESAKKLYASDWSGLEGKRIEIFHGTIDGTIMFSQSVSLSKKLENIADVSTSFPNRGHSFLLRDWV